MMIWTWRGTASLPRRSKGAGGVCCCICLFVTAWSLVGELQLHIYGVMIWGPWDGPWEGSWNGEQMHRGA